MSVQRALKLTIPAHGVLAAESIHGPRFQMTSEQHVFHELYFVYEGSVTVHHGGHGGDLELRQGTFLPIPAATPHSVEDQSQTTLLLLCLSDAYVGSHGQRQALWETLKQRKYPAIAPDVVICNGLERALRRILAEQSSPRVGGELAITTNADAILIALARVPDQPDFRDAQQRVADVVTMMEETFFDPWDLETAASHAHLSRRRFSQLFREQTGHSFLEAVNRLRLQHAASLLERGETTITGAAFACGLGDLRNFYRLFKKYYAMTPGEWVKKK
jgi:AraC-like DNA-binding protein